MSHSFQNQDSHSASRHALSCQCGSLQGHIDLKGASSRARCYCRDCQAFARYLGQAAVMDAQGGTEVIQVAQPCFHVTKGHEYLAALRLSPKGLVRWYASCCNTPIGNTTNNPKVSFIGVVDVMLDKQRLDADFGSDVAVANADSAMGEPKPKNRGIPKVVLNVLKMTVPTWLSGRYQRSELFQDGMPVVPLSC